MARPRSDIRPRLLRAARQRFLADGVDGASLRRIAQAARTNIGMIYYYFPSKDFLFLAVIEERYAVLLADMQVALAPDAPIADRLRRFYERLGRLTDDELAVVRLVIRELLVSSSRRRRIVERFLQGHIPLIVSTILEGVQTGALTARHPPVVLGISTVTLALFPQILQKIAAADVPDALRLPSGEELARALVDVLLGGIATPAAAAAAPVAPPAATPRAGRVRRKTPRAG